MSRSKDHDSHQWMALTPDPKSPFVVVKPVVQVFTCTRCGLLQLQTISNIFYFVQMTDPFIECYRKANDDVRMPSVQDSV